MAKSGFSLRGETGGILSANSSDSAEFSRPQKGVWGMNAGGLGGSFGLWNGLVFLLVCTIIQVINPNYV